MLAQRHTQNLLRHAGELTLSSNTLLQLWQTISNSFFVFFMNPG